MKCPGCDIETTENAKFCSGCSFPLSQENPVKCNNCETLMFPKAQFCHECGNMANEPDYERIAGVNITDEDIGDLLFGHLEKEINLGRITINIRTLDGADRKQIAIDTDKALAEISKDNGHMDVSDRTYLEVSESIELAAMLLAVNGKASPEVNKVDWVDGLPFEVAKIALQRGRLLSQIVGQLIQRGQVSDF